MKMLLRTTQYTTSQREKYFPLKNKKSTSELVEYLWDVSWRMIWELMFWLPTEWKQKQKMDIWKFFAE